MNPPAGEIIFDERPRFYPVNGRPRSLICGAFHVSKWDTLGRKMAF